MAAVDYGTTEWGTSDDIDQFSRQLAAFCTRAAEISNENPPPGANAASGWFRKGMNEDPKLLALLPPKGKADDAEAAELFQITNSFKQGIKGAFSPANHSSSWTKSGALALEAIKLLGEDITKVIKDVAAVAAFDAAAISKIAGDIKALTDKIRTAGIVFEGEHANGYIQINVANVAKNVEAAAAGVVAKAVDPHAKKYAEVLVAMCKDLSSIPQYANDPWLYAEWQVKFQAIMAASGQALVKI